MNVALMQVDGKYPNLALMKLASWHKGQGDTVTRYSPLFDTPDLLYASKAFDFTPDSDYWPECEVVRGGYGYNTDALPSEVEACVPDYDLFGCEYAMGYTTRGCPRGCSFCVVPKLEGTRPTVVGHIADWWTGQKHVRLLDANITSLPDHMVAECEWATSNKVAVDFNQGLDLRLLTSETADAVASVRLWGNLHGAWDKLDDEEGVMRGITLLRDRINIRGSLLVYVLCGYDSTIEDDLYRIGRVMEAGATPFVMLYRRDDPRLRAMARWCNRPQLLRACTFAEYEKGQPTEKGDFLAKLKTISFGSGTHDTKGRKA